MTRRAVWAALIIPIITTGYVVGRLHLLADRPSTFFFLGVAATLCVVGAIHYAQDAIKLARAGKRYGN